MLVIGRLCLVNYTPHLRRIWGLTDGERSQECYSHAHAVVCHAASTTPSAPDHAPVLSPIGRCLNTPLRTIGGAFSHAPHFPTVFETLSVSEAEEKTGKRPVFSFKCSQKSRSTRHLNQAPEHFTQTYIRCK